MKKKFFSLFTFLLILYQSLNAQGFDLKILNQTSSELLLEIKFDKPIIKNFGSVEKNKKTITIDGLINTNIFGEIPVPVLTKQFSLAGEKFKSSLIDVKTVNHNIDIKYNEAIQRDPRYLKEYEFYKIEFSGYFRDLPIYNLSIFPVDANNSSITWIKKIKLRVWIDDKKNQPQYEVFKKSTADNRILSKMLINNSSINYKKTPTLNLYKSVNNFKSGRYKIAVNEDGIYKITGQDLIDAGMDIKSLNPKKIRLFNKGQEVAIYFKGSKNLVFDASDYFEFWGEKNKNTFLSQSPDMYTDPFSDVNIYWLEHSQSTGLRMVEESGALIVSNPAQYVVPIFYNEKLHFEKDNHFEHFGQAGAKPDLPSYHLDLWFYDSGIIASGLYSYDAFVPYPYETGTNSVFIKTMMRGRSYRDFVNNQNINLYSHEVELFLNEGTNNKIGESGLWQDQELHIIQNSVGLSQSLLQHGLNELKVNMDQLGVSDAVLMNWFEIEYLRKYRAFEDFLVFRKQEGISTNFMFQFEIDGFTNPNIEVYKKGVSKIVNHRIDFYTDQDDNFSSYRISFQDSIFYSGIEYVALTQDQKKKPISIVLDLPWIEDAQTDVSLLDQNNSADYLIITHELLYDNVIQLQQFHQQKGLNTALVKVQDIYDEFNYGIKSPLAIKEFIKYVYNRWDQNHKLYYLNLVGTASENYKTTSQIKPDLVPTILFQTKKYGASAADFQYSLLSGDENDFIPDLVVGRIPAKNNSEFLNYLDKIINYDAQSDIGLWTNKSLMISGNDENTKELQIYPNAFRAQNQRIMNFKIPDEFFMRKLNTIRDEDTTKFDPNFGGTTDLINYWDDGLAYINFFGHGGGGIWADVQLFNVNDIDRLNNNYRLPFISSMTCFTGAFESKSFSSIADKLITVANKGAIGVYASSGLGWLHNDFAIGWALAENLFNNRLSIGESILLSKIFYLGNGVYFYDDGATILYDYGGLRKSMVNQYNLIGEPNLYLPIPSDEMTIKVNNSLPSVGDTIEIEVNSALTSGEIYVELANEDNEPLVENFDVIQSTGNNFSVVIPDELDKQVGYIKGYATDNIENVHGYTKIAVKKSLLDSVTIVPRDPEIGDSLYIFAHIHSETPVENVTLRNLSRLNKNPQDFILLKLSDTLFTTSSYLGPYNEEGTWFFTIEIQDTSGNVAQYHQQKFTISDPRPDLEIVKNSFKFTGTNEIQISAQVKNNYNHNIAGLNIGFFEDSYNYSSVPFYSITEQFLAKQTKTLNFNLDADKQVVGKKFIIVVDYDSTVAERNEKNNIDSSLVYESFIFINSNIGTVDTLNIQNIAKLYIASNSLKPSSTLTHSIINDKDKLELDSQPGFNYIPFGSATDSVILNIHVNNRAARLETPAYLAFEIDTTMSMDSLNHVGIYRFSNNLNQWIKMPNDIISGNYKYIQTHELGKFALFYVNDNESPVIEITVNGRALRNDMLVPDAPELAVLLQDENGIDISNGIFIKVDDDTIPRSEMNVPDSLDNANAIAVLTTPKFQTGEHSLVVIATDANGNMTTKALSFKTSGNFDVLIYGNYPNPFTDDTYISYYVDSGGLLDEFSVKIYTVAGRMIRKLDTSDQRFREPDYYEAYWDGRDDDGNIVANGVYFAIVYAKFQGQEVEHRLKLAKLK